MDIAPPPGPAGANDPREVLFERLSAPTLNEHAARDAPILIPFGATEQHGTHLPVDTDTFLATSVAVDVARELEDALVAPAVPWGLSAGHRGLGATLTITPATALSLVTELAESLLASGFRRQIWINGHAGNRPLLALLVYHMQDVHGVGVSALTYFDFARDAFAAIRQTDVGGEGHGGEFETSMMLYLRPDSVGAVGAAQAPIAPLTRWDVRDLFDMGSASIGFSFADRFPTGIAGDASPASAKTAEAVYPSLIGELVAFARAYVEQTRAGAAARNHPED
jgi:creatinine amidohydrolase